MIDAMFLGDQGLNNKKEKKKTNIKHSNGFPYCLLIYTE